MLYNIKLAEKTPLVDFSSEIPFCYPNAFLTDSHSPNV